MLAAHIRWGDEESRRDALEKLADWIQERRKSKHVKDKDMIVLGDFNIPAINDSLYDAITKNGLVTHEDILGEQGTNLERNKRYDQIFYHKENANRIEKAGSVDFYVGDYRTLYPESKYADMTKCKFTYQISDHLPLWIQLDIE